ncbi:MAG: adenosine kinase [Cyanobacteria bacterium P01_E01_bin.42]
MKKYNVYGIGNALVDMEFEISAEQLQEFQIDKGVMTLVDEMRHWDLVDRLKTLPSKRICGGSAANSMVAVSQFGGKAYYSCKVAADETGSFFLEDLLRCGVETNLQHQPREDGITGKCLVFVTPDADRTMNTFLGIAGNLATSELVEEELKDSEYLYIEGYLMPSPTGKEAAIRAREMAEEAGVKTSLSLSDPNMAEFFKEPLLKVIGSGLDFIFANETEVLKLAETENINDGIAYLKTLTKCFAVTRGSQGSLIFDGEKMLEIAPVTVEAIDTVGAGDMYAGAFLYGITHGMSFTEAGNLASRAAAKVVSRFGPRMATEALQSLLSNPSG